MTCRKKAETCRDLDPLESDAEVARLVQCFVDLISSGKYEQIALTCQWTDGVKCLSGLLARRGEPERVVDILSDDDGVMRFKEWRLDKARKIVHKGWRIVGHEWEVGEVLTEKTSQT